MELRQLRYFVAVAERRHFGQAAEDLHIVQPAVSQQVARLERELGLVLFDRSRRRIDLTPDGRAFLPHAQQVLAASERASRVAAELALGVGGMLRVGSSEVLGPRLEAILTAFRERRPAATLALLPGSTSAKLDALAAGDLDAAFVRAAEPTPGITVHPLWDEPLLVAMPAARSPADADRVGLADLADLPLAQATRAANPGVFDLITGACRTAGFTPRPGPVLGSVQDLLAAHVAAGSCWTLLYASTPRAEIPASVALRQPEPLISVPTGLAVPTRPRRPLVQPFLEAALAAAR
jgi:DNA-binding transcriptional LysR family regulator